MGADMIMSYVAVEKDATLDWDKVDEAIAALSDQQVAEGLDQAGIAEDGPDGPDPEFDRQAVRDVFKKLRGIFEDGDYSRELATIEIRGLELTLSGGMSWGDMPSDAAEILGNAWAFPSVLTAIGFADE